MTTTTYRQLPGSESGVSFGGWFGRFFWRMIEAQEQRITLRVGKIFSTYDDAYLKKLGYSAPEIAQLRRKFRTS